MQILRLPPLADNKPETLSRHVVELNKRLDTIAQALEEASTKLTLKGDLDAGGFRIKNIGTAQSENDSISPVQLQDAMDKLDDEFLASVTSEGDEEGVGGPGRLFRRGTSRFRRQTDDAIVSALADALPTAAPPNVAAVSDIGTTFDPPHFSLQDHTHGGVIGSPPAGGVAGQVAFFTSSFTIGGDPGMTYDATENALHLGGSAVGKLYGSDAQGNIGLEISAAAGTTWTSNTFIFLNPDIDTILADGLGPHVLFPFGLIQPLSVDLTSNFLLFSAFLVGSNSTPWTITGGNQSIFNLFQYSPTIQSGDVGGGNILVGLSAAFLYNPVFKSISGPNFTANFDIGHATISSTPMYLAEAAGTLDVSTVRGFLQEVNGGGDGAVVFGQIVGFEHRGVVDQGGATLASITGADIGFKVSQTLTQAPIFRSFYCDDRFRTMVHFGAANFGADAEVSNASVGLELQSTTKAFLPSRLTTAEETALTPLDGMFIYNSDIGTHRGYQAGAWVSIPGSFTGTVTSVAGGEGITNTPEPIVGAGTVDLDINSLTTETTLAAGDLFAFVDVSVGTSPSSQRKVTFADMSAGLVAGGFVTGTGAAGRVAFWTGASTIDDDAQLLWDSATNTLTVTGTAVITGKLTVGGDIDPTRVLLTGADKRFGATDAGSVYLAPFTDSTTGVQVRKADNTTVVIDIDTTNSRLGVGVTPTEKLHVSLATASTTVAALLAHTDDTSATSHAAYQVTVGGASAGDPTLNWRVTGATNWVAGIDNSDADSFKITPSSVLGTGDVLTLTTGGFLGIGTTAPADVIHAISESVATLLRVERYGNAVGPNIEIRQALGTFAVPTATQLNNALGAIVWMGQGATVISGQRAKITAVAAENWTDTAQGAFMNFEVTANGGTTRTTRMRLGNDGFLGLGNNTLATEQLDVSGNIQLKAVGNKFRVKEGTNASMGVATMVAGTVVVNNTLVTATSRIFLTINTPGGTPSAVRVSARTAGTSFTITSLLAGDTSTVAWLLIEPAP